MEKYEDQYTFLSENQSIPSNQIDFELKQLHKNFENELNASNQNLFGSFLTFNDENILHQVFYFTDNL